MPKQCIICKSLSSPFEKRSFHIFPKDELMKNKWIESLNLSNKKINFKTAFVCCAHFDEKSFYEQGELHTRRRLHLDAVPQLINTVKPSTSVVSENNSEECNTLQDTEIIYIKSEVEDSDVKDISLQSNLDESSYIPTFNTTDEMSWENSNEDISNLNNQTENNSSNIRKRKKPSLKLRTKVRFMTGFQTEHMCAEDFRNEEAWNKFLRYVSYCKSITSAAYSRNQRKEKKINTLKRMIVMLKQKYELNSAEYLKVVV